MAGSPYHSLPHLAVKGTVPFSTLPVLARSGYTAALVNIATADEESNSGAETVSSSRLQDRNISCSLGVHLAFSTLWQWPITKKAAKLNHNEVKHGESRMKCTSYTRS